MERGFPVLRTSHGNVSNEWVIGEPERSFWTGLKLGDRKRLKITAYRCPRCGRLESFAPEG